MFFLLRMAFWLSIVLILLPSGAAHRAPSPDDIGASDAVAAASATVHDLKGFCAREPAACEVGSHVVTALGYRARDGAKMLYDFLTDALAPSQTGSVVGNPIAVSRKLSLQRASQDTLTPTDLAPEWRGGPRRSGRHPA